MPLYFSPTKYFCVLCVWSNAHEMKIIRKDASLILKFEIIYLILISICLS